MLAPAHLAFTKLTCVFYEDGDLFGRLMAHIALVPIFVIVALTAILFLHRSPTVAWLLGGLVLGEGFNRGIKRAIGHPRPEASPVEGLGMPSSHTQFAFFCAAFLIALLRTSPSVKARRPVVAGILLPLAILAAAVTVASSRVYLHYHSVPQVGAGASLGLALGVAWVNFGRRLVLPLVASRLEQSAVWNFCSFADGTFGGSPKGKRR